MQTSWNSHTLLVGIKNDAVTLQKVGKFLVSWSTLTIRLNLHTPAYLPYRNKSICVHKTCTQVLEVMLLAIVKPGNNPNILQQVNGLITMHTVEYYSGIKRKELLPYVTAWGKFKGVMPHAIYQSLKVTYCAVLFISHSPKDKIAVVENRPLVARV